MAVNHQQAFVRVKLDRVLGNGDNAAECQAQADHPGTVSVQARHAGTPVGTSFLGLNPCGCFVQGCLGEPDEFVNFLV